jgi:hypothetical protein
VRFDWLAIVAAITALVAVVVAWRQLRLFQFAHGVDLLFDLERRFFETPKMQIARRVAAESLKQKASSPEVEPVLDFFETLGILVRRHAIDAELAWSSFSHWVLRYSEVARGSIEARRRVEADATYYEEFDWLVRRFAKIDKRRRPLTSSPLFSKEQLDDFLDDETSEN